MEESTFELTNETTKCKIESCNLWSRFVTIPLIIIFLLVDFNFLFLMAKNLQMNDFGKFYYATVEYLQGKDFYGPTQATFMPVTESEKKHYWNMNPPHFHLIILPLALLPAASALTCWFLSNILCLILSLRLIIKELRVSLTLWQKELMFLGIVAFSGTGAFLATGQMSFVLLLPFTLAWVKARNGHWESSGFYLGICVSLKLFMLIFLPYLILRRHFKAFGVAFSTVLIAFALGLLIFGVESHRHWLRVLAAVDWEWAVMNASLKGFLARVFDQSPYYQPLFLLPWIISPLWLVLAFIVGSITMLVSWKGSSLRSVDRSFAILFAGSQIISPLGWIYYLFVLIGPLAALISSWVQQGSGNLWSIFSGQRKLYVLLAMAPGLILPFPFAVAFQPYAWATIVPGSLYFFALLGIWMSIVIDWCQVESQKVGF